MGAGRTLALAVFVLGAGAQFGSAQVDPANRTAQMPDSWLVLYNANDAESIGWKDWYLQQWGIPTANALGLDVSGDERVLHDHFKNQIFYPVRDYLNNHPDVKARIMGILVGYRVPGNFYKDATHPENQGGGGWSVSNNLQDMQYCDWFFQRGNPYYFCAYSNPNQTQLTKAGLSANWYMTARLDGPTLADVQALTLRAKAITESAAPLPVSERLYYDYLDVGSPAGPEWPLLKNTVQSGVLTTPAWRFPWLEFESESEPTPDCAMRFCYYRIDGWHTVPWGGTPSGTRILGMAMNSWGATTVRSTTAQGGRYVPNALVNGGFAAALGATAEPWLGNEPVPATLVWCLAQGWTLGEAAFRANPFSDFMWELLGDPLMTVPQWWVNLPPDPPSDLGPPAYVDGSGGLDKTPYLEFIQSDDRPGTLLAYRIQIDDDGDFGSPVVDYTSGWLPQGATGFVMGQGPGEGSYSVGGEGQALAPGSYYWRVRSDDGESEGDWSTANDGLVAFVVIDPPVMVSAVSRKTHGSSAQNFDIALPLGSAAPVGIECRTNGPTLVVVTFNVLVVAADGVPDATEVNLSAGALNSVTIDGRELQIALRDVPDQCCLAITLSGICDSDGHALLGDHDVHVGNLLADVTGNSRANLTDVAEVAARNGLAVNSASARFDLNVDGYVNLIDMALAKSRNGSWLICP